MRILMKSYAPGGVLAGALDGQRVLADLLKKTQLPVKPEVYFYDFEGIEIATTSFLRDSIVAYRNHARAHWPNLYPVAANLAAVVREDLEVILNARGDAFVVCRLSKNGTPSAVEIIGQIDGKQRVALDAVLRLGESDAASVAEHVAEKVAPTAWNNRLGALVAKGILMEVSSGRNKRYRPVLEGLKHGA